MRAWLIHSDSSANRHSTRVRPSSVLANVLGSICVVIGFLAGAVLTLVGLSGLAPSGLDGLEGAVFSPLAIFVLPIVGGLKGYLVGAFAAWVFNRVAPHAGGLEIEAA